MTTDQAGVQSSRPTNQTLRRLLKGILYGGATIVLLLLVALIVFSWQARIREAKTRVEAAPQTGRYVRAGDVDIFVQEMGPASGPVILFVHGTGAWSEIWRETMVDLSDAGYRSIAIDMPPFGFSETPSSVSYGRHDQALRIIGVLDALDIPRATLVGHSFGGGATVEAALLSPDRFQALVLIDVALGLEENEGQEDSASPILNGLFAIRPLRNALIAATITNPLMSKKLLQLLILDPADATDARVKMLQRQLTTKNGTDTLGDWLLDFLTAQEESLSTDLAAYQTLKMPVFVMWGDSDTIVPASDGESLERMIPDAELVILEQTGHVPQIEDVRQFNDALLEFLSR